MDIIPKGAGSAIRDGLKKCQRERVEEIEKSINHDIMAVVKALNWRLW